MKWNKSNWFEYDAQFDQEIYHAKRKKNSLSQKNSHNAIFLGLKMKTLKTLTLAENDCPNPVSASQTRKFATLLDFISNHFPSLCHF